jgi:hypothetical protein
MTESEWLACTNNWHLRRSIRERISDRKTKLFEVACCRRIWNLITHEASRNAVEMAERFADGVADVAELERAFQAADAVAGTACADATAAFDAAPEGAEVHEFYAAAHALEAAAAVANDSIVNGVDRVAAAATDDYAAEEVAQADLVRELFGNPYRPVALDSAWLTWNSGTVGRIAQAIYDERTFDRMPVLADALEDAGCMDQAILDHCRQPGEHVRGCWVVDLLLGKS